MTLITRYLEKELLSDLAEKMVFLGGPRQVGKTTTALQFLSPSNKKNPAYLNWDILAHRSKIKNALLPANEELIILDEIHKFRRWRGVVKGFFDQYFPEKNFLVTGSARLDYYRKGGDALHGRYHYWRLHPLSLSELPSPSMLESLLEYGGFPEPFTKQDKRFWKRWSRERNSRIVNEDIRDLESVKDLSLIELLLDELPARVSSLLSLNSLAEDLELSPRTVDRWIEVLERMYFCFRIAPYGAPKIRAVKKSRKLYLWDWAAVESGGARFENLVASQLLKYCHYHEDRFGDRMELRFLRDTAGREIDFIVLKNRKAIFAVECKSGDDSISKHIHYFREKVKIPAYYQVHMGTKNFGSATQTAHVLPFKDFVQELQMP